MPRLRRVRAPTLLIVGGADLQVLELNRQALDELQAVKRLDVIPSAGHLFEEPGALDHVTELAARWLSQHLGAAGWDILTASLRRPTRRPESRRLRQRRESVNLPPTNEDTGRMNATTATMRTRFISRSTPSSSRTPSFPIASRCLRCANTVGPSSASASRSGATKEAPRVSGRRYLDHSEYAIGRCAARQSAESLAVS